jgi:hypothetical protein
MRITGGIALLLLVCTGKASAQFTKEVPLKLMYKQGWNYFYGGEKMNSAYALQIPFHALGDNEINDRFRKYKKLRQLRPIAYLPSLVYLLTSVHFRGGHRGYSARSANTETFILLFGGGIAGDLTLNLLSHHQMAKAIEIYNFRISGKSTLGLSFNRLPNKNFPSFTYEFKF